MTSMRSAATSNSQRASITSRPLFISVAESTVIFGPICQVGWFSASAARHRRQLARRHAAERAARGGQDQPPDLGCGRGRAGIGGWRCARCRPAAPRRRALRGRHHDRAGHHEDFLVRERDRLARLDRGEHGVERRGAGRREEDDIGVGMRGDVDQPLRPVLRSPAPRATAGSAPPAPPAARRCRRRRGRRRAAWSGAHPRPRAHSGRSIPSSRGSRSPVRHALTPRYRTKT